MYKLFKILKNKFKRVMTLVVIIALFYLTLKHPSTNEDGHHQYVAISVYLNISQDYYMFYLPIVCEAWRRVGYEPLILVVIDATLNNEQPSNNQAFRTHLLPLQLKVLEYLRTLRVNVLYVKALHDYEVTLAMIARIFVGFLSKAYVSNTNAFILLSDADLIPINATFYTAPINIDK
jgi:hypothetical protein